MTKNEFLTRFNLNARSASIHKYRHHSPLKQAAVLIPLIDDGTQLHVLLTKRAIHLRHHAGQISFPGGKEENEDKSLVETAFREAQEEIGLSPKNIEVIGNLHSYHVISGFEVTPIIAFIPNHYQFIKDSNEVSEIFQVPLQHFLENKNHISFHVKRRGFSHHVHFMPYKHYNIWGATASMLKDLVVHLK